MAPRLIDSGFTECSGRGQYRLFFQKTCLNLFIFIDLCYKRS